MSGSLLCSSCGEGWGIHNLIQIDGLVWLVGRLRQDSTQASWWTKINHEIMSADCSKDCYSAALFRIDFMHHRLYSKQEASVFLIIRSHCKLVGVVLLCVVSRLFTVMFVMREKDFNHKV